MDAMAFRSMHEAADGVAREREVVLDTDLGGVPASVAGLRAAQQLRAQGYDDDLVLPC